MKYISGKHALNLPCSLNTSGDWHTSSLDWNNLILLDSSNSIFRDYGIELNKSIPEHRELFNVANTLRAILDLMTDKNNLLWLNGFRKDFICTDEYNEEFFTKVYLLRNLSHWNEIHNLMLREYKMRWLRWTGEKSIDNK